MSAELAAHAQRLEAERLRPTRDERNDPVETLGRLVEVLALGLFGIPRAPISTGAPRKSETT